MKKIILIGIVFFLCSCGNDDSVCGSLNGLGLHSKSSDGLVNELLAIEFLNVDGENIFENGTYNPNEVTLTKDVVTYKDVVDLNNQLTKNLILINGYVEGENTYSISLAPTESMISKLTVDATMIDFSSCTGPVFRIDSVFYNGKKQSLKALSNGVLKFSVTK